jgi:hypothetical protein
MQPGAKHSKKGTPSLTRLAQTVAHNDIALLTEEILQNPYDFLRGKSPHYFPESRKAIAQKTLKAVIQKFSEGSNGTITKENVEDAIISQQRNRFLALAYTLENSRQDRKTKAHTLLHAGETFSRGVNPPGTHGRHLIYTFIKANNLAFHSKAVCTHLQAAFQESVTTLHNLHPQLTREELAEELAVELHRKHKYRLPSHQKLFSAKEVAEAFCQLPLSRIAPKNLERSALDYKLRKDLEEFIASHPLKPIYERNGEDGQILYRDGKPIFREDIPEKWKTLTVTPLKAKIDAISSPKIREELDTLRQELKITAKPRIPLEIAWEELEKDAPALAATILSKTPSFLELASFDATRECQQMAYESAIISAAQKKETAKNPNAPQKTFQAAKTFLEISASHQ